MQEGGEKLKALPVLRKELFRLEKRLKSSEKEDIKNLLWAIHLIEKHTIIKEEKNLTLNRELELEGAIDRKLEKKRNPNDRSLSGWAKVILGDKFKE